MGTDEFLKAKEKINEIFEKLNTIRDEVIKKKNQNEYYRGRTGTRKDVSQKIKDIDDQIQQLLLKQRHLLSKMASSMKSLKNCQK
uniref:Structural maintenance of chromosomes protein 5 n=1 Tax=Saccharomyces cerevisiae TaxID=4932 RepID=UPI001E1BDF62|nr:Chain B, Structural maintenance of chromosomes protein 5 [Saccharomyces cerevisiae]